jgi:hypothetical protein
LNSEGCIGEQSVSEVVVIVGLDDEESALTIFPNPVQHLLHVRFSSDVPQVITITDMLGKDLMVLSADKQEETFDVRALPPGLYLLRVETTPGKRVVRFLKRN